MLYFTYLVAVAIHMAFASPTSGHFVASSNQSPNCLIGSRDTSWLSSKHWKHTQTFIFEIERENHETKKKNYEEEVKTVR